MKRIQNVKRTLALILAMMMVLTSTAFANWETYQGNDDHNGVITDGAPTGETKVKQITLTNNGSGWDGVDTAPVMETIDGITYAYVLYDGYTVSGQNGGGRLAKINCNTGTQVWSKQVTTRSGFQLSSPLLDGDVIYIGASSAAQVLDGLNSGKWTVDGKAVTGDVTVPADTSKTLTLKDFKMSSTPTNRVALGIYLGTSSTTSASATVSWKVNGVEGSKSFTSKDILQDGKTGNYYFYLNQNIPAVPESGANAIEFTVKMENGAGTVTYAEMYQQTAAIQEVTGIHSDDVSDVDNRSITAGTDISGQINTPITKYGDYLYFGTWTGLSGTYYQVNLKDKDAKPKTYTSPNGGFYWAGAVVVDGNVYFGGDANQDSGDGGYLYITPVERFGEVEMKDGEVVKDYTTVIDLNTKSGLADGTAGNVRSSIMKHGDYLYFTSQGGYLWKYNYKTGDLIYANIGYTSTSTPTISENNVIYVGSYGWGTGNYGVRAISLRNFTANVTNAADSEWTNVFTGGSVQSSVIVYTKNRTDYIYFTTNVSGRRGVLRRIGPREPGKGR